MNKEDERAVLVKAMDEADRAFDEACRELREFDKKAKAGLNK